MMSEKKKLIEHMVFVDAELYDSNKLFLLRSHEYNIETVS